MKSIVKIFFLNLLFTTTIIAQDDEYGIASYYSDLFQGKPVASGELYDKAKLTAAHKTLPFGTTVKVTRLDNDKSVQVRINDRGPFISGRVIELSREAASRINLLTDGATRVKVEVIKEKASEPLAADASKAKPKAYDQPVEKIEKTAEKPTSSQPKAAEKETAKVNQKPTVATTAKSGAASTSSAGKTVMVKSQDYQTYDLYEVSLKRPEKKGFGVQVAALSSQDALFRKIAELQGEWFDNILVSIEKGQGADMMYKVILGRFATEAEAQGYKKSLKSNKKIDGFVVDLASVNK